MGISHVCLCNPVIASFSYQDNLDKKELAEYYRYGDIFVLRTREDVWG